MRFLVAGGAGFLGSHLCQKLLSLNHEVICVDNLSTGNLDNIRPLIGTERFSFRFHDVVDPLIIEKLDGIFNFACPASPLQYQKSTIQTLKTSVLGAVNLLELADRTNSKILQASTSEIYGDPLVSPQVETYWGNVNPIGIRACYDEGKRAAETLFMDSFRKNFTKIQIARIFNTYGSNMRHDDGRVVSNFIMQALLNQPLTIYGDGKQLRSFCFVDDLIVGVIKLFHSESFSGPLNLGNPASITIIDLAGEIIELTKSQSKMIFLKLPSDDPKQRKPDITKATNELGWKPIVSRNDGLMRTIEYFRSLISTR